MSSGSVGETDSAIIATRTPPDTDELGCSALEVVISGGQTGADRAGLLAALEVGLATGGWMPEGFVARDGPHPEFAARFGIREMPGGYPARTRRNVRESDATVRLAIDFLTPGEVLTLRAIRHYVRPHFDIDMRDPAPPAEVARWLIANRVRVLNVSGNLESGSGEFGEACREYLAMVFRALVRS